MHHHTKVDHLKVVALQHHAHDVLADVMNIPFDRSHENLAVGLRCLGLLRLDVGLQVSHGLFHDTGALDHLREKHLAVAEEVADHVHAVHQRAFNHLDRPVESVPRFLGVLYDPGIDTFDQCVLNAFRYRSVSPGEVFDTRTATAAVTVDLGEFQQSLCRVFVAI